MSRDFFFLCNLFVLLVYIGFLYMFICFYDLDFKEFVEGVFQDVEVYNSDIFGLGECVLVVEVLEFNEQVLKDGIRNVEEFSDNVMVLVFVIDEVLCENYIFDSVGGVEGN